MSTDLTKFQSRGVAVVELPPALKVALDQCFDRVWPGVHGETGHFVKGRTPTATEVEAAKSLLPCLDASLARVSPPVLKAWLQELAMMLPIGGAATDKNRVINAINSVVQSVGDLPAICFTDETRREILRNCEFFPGPRKAFEILNQLDEERRKMTSAVRRIADYAAQRAPQPPDLVPPDPTEKAKVGELLASLGEKLQSGAADRARENLRVKPSHLNRLELARAASPQVLAMRPDLQKALEITEVRQ